MKNIHDCLKKAYKTLKITMLKEIISEMMDMKDKKRFQHMHKWYSWRSSRRTGIQNFFFKVLTGKKKPWNLVWESKEQTVSQEKYFKDWQISRHILVKWFQVKTDFSGTQEEKANYV